MALTAAYEAKQKDGELITYPISANAKIWKGALVCRNASGYAVAAADAASYALLGVAAESCDNTGGANGALSVRLYKTGSFVYGKAGATQADVGAAVYCTSDDTVAGTAVNSVLAGYVTALESSGKVRVRIDNAVR